MQKTQHTIFFLSLMSGQRQLDFIVNNQVCTMHHVGFLEIFSGRVHTIWIRAERLNVLFQVPADVLIHHTKHEDKFLVHISTLILMVVWSTQGS